MVFKLVRVPLGCQICIQKPSQSPIYIIPTTQSQKTKIQFYINTISLEGEEVGNLY